MLRELHISNLAVIADARIELASGLNCFTGTTGAGKSLVIGAIEILLALRSPADMLRDGADEARVSGIFEVADERLLARAARLCDAPLEREAPELLVTRRLHASGRTSASVNGHPITLPMLRGLAELLIDVHGQHDHQYLLRPSNQLEVLDEHGRLGQTRARHADLFRRLRDARRRLDELVAGAALRRGQLELLRFQADEIDGARLDPAEYAELCSRAAVLQNLERLKRDAGATHAALQDCDGSILERLRAAAAIVAEMASIDETLKPVAQALRDGAAQVDDAAFELGRYMDRLDLDPSELAEVQDRLNAIHRVLSKHGDTVEAALARRAGIAAEIGRLDRDETDLAEAEALLTPLRREAEALAAELSRGRRRAADDLAPRVQRELAELGMERAAFRIDLSESEPSASGRDAVEFVVQTNPGLAAQPLARIASGGELSRVMLALKGVLAAGDRVSVLVFDEIDANVGGRLGATIGRKLLRLSRRHQVLCITHLPQIACYATRHLTVRKDVAGASTRTRVRAIDGDERVQELAEMIGGQAITETTRAQARELLAAATSPDAPARGADGARRDAPDPPTGRAPRRPRRSG